MNNIKYYNYIFSAVKCNTRIHYYYYYKRLGAQIGRRGRDCVLQPKVFFPNQDSRKGILCSFMDLLD